MGILRAENRWLLLAFSFFAQMPKARGNLIEERWSNIFCHSTFLCTR